MFQIIILLIVIGVLWSIIEAIWSLLKEVLPVIFPIIAVLCILGGLVYLTGGVGIIVGIALFGMYYILKMNKEKKVEIEQLRVKTANIKANEGRMGRKYLYESQLREELNRNCKYLGVMNIERWKKQLPNFYNQGFDRSFDCITENFAKQMEEHIAKTADVWMKDFEKYIVKRPSGTPIHKMMEEVDCDILRLTHITPTNKILEYYLTQGTKKISEDLPAKFKISKAGEYTFYQPTPYLEHLYSDIGLIQREKSKEIIIDDDDEWKDII